ncbi:MAG: ImmA/IrrE family metallo-endopeptidase [Fimbriimonadaceae bacterium]|nr:ImmA/IrrE family metallo-endopeptidase [Fimbriimonadaceae bacterium]QYK59134.1 MAG: ImmA/IrrE family metallo-endopeptidase [Fimbriimonadaceae bacterium]
MEYPLGISNIELGERLRVARDRAKVTQAEAAQLIGAVRTTLIAIEKGERKVRLEELQKLAARYGLSVNALLRRESVHLDLVPQFRKQLKADADEVESASQLLNVLVAAECELENALGVVRHRNYPPERPLLPGDVTQQADHDATEHRRWLGLGMGPISDVVGLLESELGVRVYVRPLASNISGLFAFSEVAGACVLLNANQPSRLPMTAAHEWGHLASNRRNPSVVSIGDRFTSRDDKYANAFAAALLMPAITVKQRFVELTAGQRDLTRRHVILLAANFFVSREAMVRRLEQLGLVREGAWSWFQDNGGITDEQAREVIGNDATKHLVAVRSAGLLPHRLALLVREAAKGELYSEGQLARLLQLDRQEIRQVLDGLDTEVSEASEQSQIIR